MRKMNKGMAALAAAIMTALPTGVMAATNSAQAKQETKFETSFTKNEREPRPVDENGKAINEDGSEVAEKDLLPAPEGEKIGEKPEFGQMPPQMGGNGQMPEMNQSGEKTEFGQIPPQMGENGQMPEMNDSRQDNQRPEGTGRDQAPAAR